MTNAPGAPMRIARVTLLFITYVFTHQLALVAQTPAAVAPATAPALSLAQQEEFLLKAKIVRTQGVSKGITGTVRATLTDGTVTHDASIQTIDEFRQRFESAQGTEFNFRDTWRFR